MLPREPDDVGIDDDAYEITDPKHSRWAEAMADRADMDRKRAKESLLEPGASQEARASDSRGAGTESAPGSESDLLRLKEAGFEVYGWVPMEADE